MQAVIANVHKIVDNRCRTVGKPGVTNSESRVRLFHGIATIVIPAKGIQRLLSL